MTCVRQMLRGIQRRTITRRRLFLRRLQDSTTAGHWRTNLAAMQSRPWKRWSMESLEGFETWWEAPCQPGAERGPQQPQGTRMYCDPVIQHGEIVMEC